MPLVSYEDDDSIDLFLRQQERSDRALQRQQKAEERASVQQEVTDLEESESESGDFVTGVKAGFTQTQGLGGGVKALAGSVLGNEDWVRDGLDYYNQKMSEADALGGNVTRVEDIESFGDSLDYMQYTLGTLVPDLLGGGLAGIATKAAVKGAAKNVLKESIDARVQQAVTDGAADAGNKIALKKLRKDYEQEALGKIPQRAAIGGSALYSIGMNAGENFTEIEAETGKLDPVAALTVGVAQGALDSVGVPMRAFKKLFPDRSPEGLRTAIAEQLSDNRGVVRRIITESAKTAGAEGGIEALQEVMGRAAVAWANESLPESEQQEFFEIMAGENAQSLYINSLAAGFIGGGVIGGTVEGIRPKFDPADYDDRLGKMVEAKRAAKKAAAETDNTPQENTGSFAAGQQVTVKVTNKETIDGVTRETVSEEPAIIREEVSKRTGKRGVYLEYQGQNDRGKRDYIEIDGENVLNPKIEIISDIQQEKTVELGEMPLEPEENTIYLGSLPGPLQKQLIADGVQDDIAPIETVQASIEKLDGIEQQRAKSSLEKQGIASRRRRKVQPEKEPGAVEFEGPIFTVSTPQSLKEKQTELEQQAKEGSEKIQVNGDDTFVPESISFSSLLKTITPARGGDPLVNNRDEAEDPVTLQSLVDHYDNPRNPLDVPELEETMSIYLDLVDRGVPRQHIESVTGTYAIEGNVDLPDDAVAAYFPQSGAVGINTEQLTEGLSSDQAARVNRFAMAHEVWHSADSEQSYSDTLPDFAMEFADVDGDGLPDMLLGDVVDELYGNWENGTDLGKRFGYPFNYLEAMLNDAAPEDRPAILRATQREVFAQLGAMLTANPKLLKQKAPKAYNLIKSLRDNPTLTAEDITSEQTQDQTDNPSTDATAVPGQVRAPPISGSPEVQVDGGTERVGGDGLDTGQADQELGEQAEPDDGDAAGRLLRQQVIDFVASQGEVQGKSPIQLELRQGYNPTVELIDEMLADGLLEEAIGTDGVPTYTVPQDQQVDAMRQPQQPITGEVANERQQRIRDRAERLQSGGITTLDGAPVIENATGPDPRVVAAAEEYAEQNGISYSRQETYVEVSPERAARIAQAYDEMEHNPQDPAVKEAYDDLIRQTRAQYDVLVDAGYEFTFFDSETDPYDGNPWNAIRDLRNNQRMAVYGTYDGYGTEGITDGDVDDNPLLVDTGLRWKDQNGVDQVVTGNDLFRAVHDAFGHGIEGAGFRARGEENAWQAHARLFTGPGLAALTSETRGQNSWLNYGPFGETNQTASVLDTVFAEQKAGLMPDWTWSEAGPASQQEESPLPMRVPSYKSGLARDVARNQAVKDLENSGIGYEDLIGDFDIDDLTVSPEFKRLLRALERDDYLGFDRIDDLMIQLFEDEDGLTNFDASPGLKSAFGRYLNDVNGFTAEDVQYIRVDEPFQQDVSFNLNDDHTVDKSVDSRLKRVMPKGLTRKLSDRLERLKDLENRFAQVLGLDRLPSAFSAYDNENLMHSKAQKQLDDFEKEHVKPIADLIADADVDLEQVGLYLLAKHAPERNAKIAQQERDLREQQIQALEEQMDTVEDESDLNLIKKKLDVLKTAPFKYQEKGSGLTDTEAEAIIELAESEGKASSLEGIADRVYQMLTQMRENMVEQGLLDNRTREDWQDTYQFYVPLKGFAAFPEGLEMKGGNGTQGFSIKGSESFKARGRITLPVNPLTVSMKDAEEKIVRGEKNRTAQKLLKMFEKFQSPDNWRVYNQKVRPPRDNNPSEMKSNQELRSERRADDGLPRYIEVKRRGKSFFIEVRDQELNRQLQSGGVGMFNNQVDFMNKALTTMQRFQNFRRNMLINYNPSWGLVNPLRDIQTGLAFAISELDAKGGRLEGKFEGATDLVGKVSKSYMPSLKAFYRARRGAEGKTDEAREYDQYAKEYIEDGAPTGLSVAKSLEEQQARFETIMGQTMKAKGINKLRPMFDWVEDANQTTENAARLATYIEARKAGVERADAATLAKDLTVNFNRKGEYSSAIDSLYLFFNAAVQGNVNIIKALTRGKKDGGVSKAQTLAASMVMFGFARTLANISFAGEDDDGESNYVDYNEYVMKTAMVFTDGRQGYAMPMPYGYGLLDNIGRFGAEMVMGIKTPEQVSVDLATSIDHHFNPMSLHATGDDRDLIESAILKGMFFLSPDIGDMAIEQIANINFFGSNVTIPQNPLMVERPAAYASKRGTNEGVTAVTEFLNDISGGSEYRSGAIDLNPERIMHFYEFLMGGVGRFLDDSSDTVMKMASEEPDLLPKDVPILRTFMPMASEYSDRVTFYSNRGDYQQYRKEYKESTPTDRRNLQQRFGPRLYQFEVTHKAIEKQLRDLRKEKKALYDDKVIDSMVRWKRLQAIAEKEERLYDEYNKRFESVRP
jgi:hypothetical protein